MTIFGACTAEAQGDGSATTQQEGAAHLATAPLPLSPQGSPAGGQEAATYHAVPSPRGKFAPAAPDPASNMCFWGPLVNSSQCHLMHQYKVWELFQWGTWPEEARKVAGGADWQRGQLCAGRCQGHCATTRSSSCSSAAVENSPLPHSLLAQT